MITLLCAFFLVAGQDEDAAQVLKKAVAAQRKAPREVHDLHLRCALARQEPKSRVTVDVEQYYQWGKGGPRDDKIVTLIRDDPDGEPTVIEGYDGSRFWVKSKDEVTVLGSDPVWQESRRSILARLQLIQMFRRVLFLPSLAKEVEPLLRLPDQDGLTRISVKPVEVESWGVERIFLAFDAKTHQLREVTIHPTEDRKKGAQLVEGVTRLRLVGTWQNEQGLTLPDTILVRQAARPDHLLDVQLFELELNQEVSDSRFAPPK